MPHGMPVIAPVVSGVIAFVGLVLVDERQTLYVAAEPLKDEGIESPVPQRLFLYADTLLGPSPPKPAYPAGFQLLAAHVLQNDGGTSRLGPADQQLGGHFVARDELGFLSKPVESRRE